MPVQLPRLFPRRLALAGLLGLALVGPLAAQGLVNAKPEDWAGLRRGGDRTQRRMRLSHAATQPKSASAAQRNSGSAEQPHSGSAAQRLSGSAAQRLAPAAKGSAGRIVTGIRLPGQPAAGLAAPGGQAASAAASARAALAASRRSCGPNINAALPTTVTSVNSTIQPRSWFDTGR